MCWTDKRDKRDRVFFGKREEELIIKQIRTISKTNIYHIIIKGNNDEVIFYDDMDRNVFLERIKITKEEFMEPFINNCRNLENEFRTWVENTEKI